MTPPPRSGRLAALALLVIPSLAACSRRDEPPSQSVPVVASRRSAAAPDSLRAGDVRIVATDGGVDLAMLGDTISTGLSPAALAKVRTETDTAAVAGSGMAASFEKLVKKTVANSIGTRVGVPLSAVRDVRYEGGAIRFDWVGTPPQLFTNTKVNNRPLLESFAPADAERFVEAVRARKLATATQQ